MLPLDGGHVSGISVDEYNKIQSAKRVKRDLFIFRKISLPLKTLVGKCYEG